MKIVYSPYYEVDIGAHVFPTAKYRLIYENLIEKGIVKKDDIIFPSPAREEDILSVHTKAYLDKLKKGALSHQEIVKLELPYSKELAEASFLCAEGTILTVQVALKDKVGIHIGGGFHHAFADHGEGFCVLNDIAIGIRVAQKDGLVKKALVVDCDLHQGNGTAGIFRSDDTVFTFSIHQENNYPIVKTWGSLDIDLQDGTSDADYIRHLEENIPRIINTFKPDLILYVAGSDPYKFDQLGGLSLSIEGLRRRDQFVIETAFSHNIPIAIVLAGGYAFDINDTVRIHTNTILEALKLCNTSLHL